MTQKTFIADEYQASVAVGDEVILIESRYEDGRNSKWKVVPFTGEGIGGNMNPEIKRAHGWRGTSYGVAVYAHGVRRVTKVSDCEDPYTGYTVQKITVGRDLCPDMD